MQEQIKTVELISEIDASVNFISDVDIGKLESRYVRRDEEKLVIYLSSQTGCNKACRMCHLTSTGQNKYRDTTLEEYISQANKVWDYYDNANSPAKKIHYNFMARGEPLDNNLMIENSTELLSSLKELADKRNIPVKFLVSTILPASLGNKELTDIFRDIHPEIYYSIYSVNKSFRKKWLPRSLPVFEGLRRLKNWQDVTGKIPRIHFAFIEGENDSESDMVQLAAAVKSFDLTVGLNIVRYNPYSEKYGRESSEEVIKRNIEILKDNCSIAYSKIVAKVGHDVKASCGQFIS